MRNSAVVQSPPFFYVPAALKTFHVITKLSKEFNSEGKEINRKTEKPINLNIEFSNDNLICDKLRNAFVHLITITKDDTKYNTIDIQIEKTQLKQSLQRTHQIITP